jgi:hypothetical protein
MRASNSTVFPNPISSVTLKHLVIENRKPTVYQYINGNRNN